MSLRLNHLIHVLGRNFNFLKIVFIVTLYKKERKMRDVAFVYSNNIHDFEKIEFSLQDVDQMVHS